MRSVLNLSHEQLLSIRLPAVRTGLAVCLAEEAVKTCLLQLVHFQRADYKKKTSALLLELTMVKRNLGVAFEQKRCCYLILIQNSIYLCYGSD